MSDQYSRGLERRALRFSSAGQALRFPAAQAALKCLPPPTFPRYPLDSEHGS